MTRTPKQHSPRATSRVEEVSGVRTQPAMPAVHDEAPAWTKTDTFRPPAAGHVDYVQLPKRRRG